MRKYKIQLPLNDSDGAPIEQEKLSYLCDELVAVFGSFAVPNRITWKYDGVEYVQMMELEIVTTDDKVPMKFLKGIKKSLRESFRTDIFITTYSVQTI